MTHFFRKPGVMLFLAVTLMVSAAEMEASPAPSDSPAHKQVMRRIIAIDTHATESRTTVRVLGNARIPDYTIQAFPLPPQIVLDIWCNAPAFKTYRVSAQSANLAGITIGHHQKKIRLTLNLKGSDVPVFTTKSVENELYIILGSPPEKTRDQGARPNTPVTQIQKAMPDQNKMAADNRKKKFNAETLKKTPAPDGREDSALLAAALKAYSDKGWSEAIRNLTRLIETDPGGRYTERAYFLLAEAYKQHHSKSIPDHFDQIRHHYEEALSRFPTSEYIVNAFLGLGNLNFKTGNYYEALGYFNFVLKNDANAPLTVKALMRKMVIMMHFKRREEARLLLGVLEDAASGLHDRSLKIEARTLIGEVLYKTNSFQKSLDVLLAIKTAYPQSIYQYPQISLYLGYNYYQLGDNVRARKNLLRFYNSKPYWEKTHLVLAQIGDSYRQEGDIEEAVKFYQLINERYPDTEGAAISLIRLAELQEEGRLKIKKGVNKSVDIIMSEIVLPKEIYHKIIAKPLNRNGNNPMAKLAMVKLAMLHRKERDFKESFQAVKELLKIYAWKSLEPNVKRALIKLVREIMQDEANNGVYINIIGIFHNEKELILKMDSADIFIAIARANIRFNFKDTAIAFFKKADPLLADKEKPADLLFLIGKELFEQGKFQKALKQMNLLLAYHPSDQYAHEAYQLKGRILLEQAQYPAAVEMFSIALKHFAEPCKRIGFLVNKAKALVESNLRRKALKTLQGTSDAINDCGSSSFRTHQEIGDLYLRLGETAKAADNYHDAIAKADEKADKISLKLKLAQSNWKLNKKEASLSLYNQIENLDDPFWSSLAKEKREELNFNDEMRQTP